jgi:hypothetical protein
LALLRWQNIITDNQVGPRNSGVTIYYVDPAIGLDKSEADDLAEHIAEDWYGDGLEEDDYSEDSFP